MPNNNRNNMRRRRSGRNRSGSRNVVLCIAALGAAAGVTLAVFGGCSNSGDKVSSTPAVSSVSSWSQSSEQSVTSAVSSAVSSAGSSSLPSSTASRTQTTVSTYSLSSFVGQSSDWRLALANRNNVIELDESAFETTRIPSKYCQDSQNYRFDSRAYDDLISMIEAAEADGVKLIVLSSYRKYSSQQRLFKNKVNYYLNKGYSQENAEKLAATVVAPPGTSDHNLGLAVDFNTLQQSDENIPSLKWLREHAEQYGFVMRYQKNKQNVTGVIYEPWHYRYVGVEHAAAMNDAGMCLEEYVESLVG